MSPHVTPHARRFCRSCAAVGQRAAEAIFQYWNERGHRGRAAHCLGGGSTPQNPTPDAGSGFGRRSIFLGEKDREHAGRLLRIGRIGRAPFKLAIVAVDLPEDILAVMVEGAEIVLAV